MGDESKTVLLRCPVCKNGSIEVNSQYGLKCLACDHSFPMVNNTPNLIVDPYNLFDSQDWRAAADSSRGVRAGIARFAPRNSVNLSRKRFFSHTLRNFLQGRHVSARRVLLVGSGQQVREINRYIGMIDGVKVVAVDIDPRADVTY